MSKGDQAIEAVGGYIVDVVGIQTSRRKRNKRKLTSRKEQWLCTMAIRSYHHKHNPKGWTWVATFSFHFLEVLYFHLACLLTLEISNHVYMSAFQLHRQLSFGAINSPRAHTDHFWAVSLNTGYDIVSLPNCSKVWNKKVQETHPEILFLYAKHPFQDP